MEKKELKQIYEEIEELWKKAKLKMEKYEEMMNALEEKMIK